MVIFYENMKELNGLVLNFSLNFYGDIFGSSYFKFEKEVFGLVSWLL